MADFDPTALLSKPLDEVKAPTPLALGSYSAVAFKYEFDKTKPKDTSKQPTPVVNISVRLVEAFPDVDAAELEAALNGKSLTEIEQRPLTYFLTEAAAHRLKELGEDHAGIDDAANLAELLDKLCDGQHPFGVTVGTVPNTKEPSKPYHQITGTFKLPA